MFGENTMYHYNFKILIEFFFKKLFRASAKKGNHLCKFGVGNLDTLKHPTIRDDVISFYKKYFFLFKYDLLIFDF